MSTGRGGGTRASLRLAALGLCFLSLAARAAAGVQAVAEVGLTVADLDREVDFFTRVLSFREEARSEVGGSVTADLLDTAGTVVRTARLRLGDETLTLSQHVGRAGRPIPPDSRSLDLWFQHVAIVVRDMDAAYGHLRRHGVQHVSTGPQTLPAWNPAAGGIRAFYFRDPEDHVLELIWFPAGKGDPRWQQAGEVGEGSPLFLGIDHTAIVVRDTERSLALYRDILGLRVAGESENHGSEQERLNQVLGARLRITALRAARGPGVELLEYLAPPGGRPLPAGSTAEDLVFWRTTLVTGPHDDLLRQLPRELASRVSRRVVELPAGTAGGGRGFVVRDPDGHALELVACAGTPARCPN